MRIEHFLNRPDGLGIIGVPTCLVESLLLLRTQWLSQIIECLDKPLRLQYQGLCVHAFDERDGLSR